MSSSSVIADVSNKSFANSNVTESSDQNTGKINQINAPTEITIPNMGNYMVNNVSVIRMEDTENTDVVEVNNATVTETLLSNVNPLEDMEEVMITDNNAINTVILEYAPYNIWKW
jgi:hypothetical protein